MNKSKFELHSYPDSISKESLQLENGTDSVLDKDPLGVYLRQISKYPLLTIQQEQEIGKKIAFLKEELRILPETISSKDNKAIVNNEIHKRRMQLQSYKNRLINANLRLVVSIAKRYQYRGMHLLDMIDEGNIGLIEAVDRFDYRRGCRFSTYGTWWIRQSIIKSLADKARVIRIPIHMLNSIKRFYFINKVLAQELGRDPNSEELAAYMNLSTEKISEIMHYSQDAASLDIDVDEDKSTRLADLIRDEMTGEPFEYVFNSALQDTFSEVLEDLSNREKDVIKLRFGLEGDGARTLHETGKILGITRERVRQIQEKAIQKLRNHKSVLDLKDIF